MIKFSIVEFVDVPMVEFLTWDEVDRYAAEVADRAHVENLDGVIIRAMYDGDTMETTPVPATADEIAAAIRSAFEEYGVIMDSDLERLIQEEPGLEKMYRLGLYAAADMINQRGDAVTASAIVTYIKQKFDENGEQFFPSELKYILENAPSVAVDYNQKKVGQK